jgi:hypothetical protein
VRDLLSTARVRVVTFALLTTQIFQLLDLTLFGILNWEAKYHFLFGVLGTTPNCVHNVSTTMAKTLNPPNVWAALEAIGVEWSLTQKASQIVSYYILFPPPGKIERT